MTNVWWCEWITLSSVFVLCSDVWSLGCVLYELCTLQHPVLPVLPLCLSLHHGLECGPLLRYRVIQWVIVWNTMCCDLAARRGAACPRCAAIEAEYLQLSSIILCVCFFLFFCGSDVAVRFVALKFLTPKSHVQFQASSWKSLILKACRGAYPPLPRHLPYELHYLVKQMFKTNPKDRPSLHTILTSHRVSKLLHPHLPSQVKRHICLSFLCGDSHSGTWTCGDFFFMGTPSITATYCQSENLNSYTTSPAVVTPMESDLWLAAVSSDGRGAHVMCLIYGPALNLLQVIETGERCRRMGRWNRGEGKKVLDLLGEKSLIKTSTFEGRVCIKDTVMKYRTHCCHSWRTATLNLLSNLVWTCMWLSVVKTSSFQCFHRFQTRIITERKCFTPGTQSAEGRFETREPGQRKQWAAAPSDTVLQALANASLMSSDSMTSSTGLTASTHGSMIYSTNVSHLLKCINIRVFLTPVFFRRARGAWGEQAEEAMGEGSSWEAAEPVRESSAEQSL